MGSLHARVLHTVRAFPHDKHRIDMNAGTQAQELLAYSLLCDAASDARLHQQRHHHQHPHHNSSSHHKAARALQHPAVFKLERLGIWHTLFSGQLQNSSTGKWEALHLQQWFRLQCDEVGSMQLRGVGTAMQQQVR